MICLSALPGQAYQTLSFQLHQLLVGRGARNRVGLAVVDGQRINDVIHLDANGTSRLVLRLRWGITATPFVCIQQDIKKDLDIRRGSKQINHIICTACHASRFTFPQRDPVGTHYAACKQVRFCHYCAALEGMASASSSFIISALSISMTKAWLFLRTTVRTESTCGSRPAALSGGVANKT